MGWGARRCYMQRAATLTATREPKCVVYYLEVLAS